VFNLVQRSGHAKFEGSGQSAVDGEFGVLFDKTDAGVEIEAGFCRAEDDRNRTAVFLKRSDGNRVYIYVDTGTSITSSLTNGSGSEETYFVMDDGDYVVDGADNVVY